MKHQIITLAFSVFTAFAFAQDSKQTLVVKTQIYCDHCIQCGSCGANINENVRTNKGIKKVKVDAKSNTITVIYNPAKTTPDKIRASINAAGFDADDKKAPAEAANKLDACCKKP